MAEFTQQEKDELIEELVATRDQILDAAKSFSADDQEQVFLGTWTVQDLLAHLIGWDLTNQDAISGLLNHQLPDFYTYIDKDWKTYNSRLVAQFKQDDFNDLMGAVRTSHGKFIDFLEGIPAGEFNKDQHVRYKGYKVTIVRLLRAEHEDEITHLGQLLAFLSQKSR